MSELKVMRGDALLHAHIRRPSTYRLLGGWLKDARGATAVEFALVAVPFFMFVFGIIGIGLHFFAVSTLENAVASAARKIRTGQAQTQRMTVGEFKEMIIEQGSGLIKPGNLQVHIQKAHSWADLTPVKCLNGDGTMKTPENSAGDDIGQHAGGAGEVVLVTACYEWDVAKELNSFGLASMANGSSLIRVATTFRTEPYE